jgi:hypothetical protein
MSSEPHLTTDTITVFYPTAQDGEIKPTKATLPRQQVIGKLDGTTAADMLRADPHIRVLALAGPDALMAWLTPDELQAFLAVAKSM